MSWKIFYCCDVNGCKVTSEQIVPFNAPFSVPEGWEQLHHKSTKENQYGGYLSSLEICPEHAKLFPKKVAEHGAKTND